MDITIRPETSRDYNAIAELNLLAFREKGQDWTMEMIIPDTLRHRHSFDSDLALVAELDGQLIGYALFSPCTFYFKGKMVKSVFLSPIAVRPEYQGKGIGGRLMKAGHNLAKEKGYSLAVLFGDKEYYQRFGYKTHTLSMSGLTIDTESLPSIPSMAVERPVEASDIETLTKLWFKWYKDEPVAMFPGPTLIDWVSHDQAFKASTITVSNKIVGYIRYNIKVPSQFVAFFTDGPENTSYVLSYLQTKLTGTEADGLHLPINPWSPWVKELIKCPYTPKVNMSQYAMMKLLDDNPDVTQYFNFLDASTDNIGVISLPAQFD